MGEVWPTAQKKRKKQRDRKREVKPKSACAERRRGERITALKHLTLTLCALPPASSSPETTSSMDLLPLDCNQSKQSHKEWKNQTKGPKSKQRVEQPRQGHRGWISAATLAGVCACVCWIQTLLPAVAPAFPAACGHKGNRRHTARSGEEREGERAVRLNLVVAATLCAAAGTQCWRCADAAVCVTDLLRCCFLLLLLVVSTSRHVCWWSASSEVAQWDGTRSGCELSVGGGVAAGSGVRRMDCGESPAAAGAESVTVIARRRRRHRCVVATGSRGEVRGWT